ncbi:MAG: TrmH family RNA methyltransferase [Novosphingobium sp.]
MQFWTYMVRCTDGSYYVGHTDDLDLRMAQHNAGTYPGHTHNRRPVELVWSDIFADRDTAFANERKLKGWSRAKKEALIRGDWDAIRQLASRSRVLRDGQEPSTGSVSSPPQDERELMIGSMKSGLRRNDPVIVLVRPQLGENIGKAARAMLNFGLAEMRLVAPRDGWPNPSAGPAAAGADVVLEKAVVFETLADAVADCAHVYATTVRKRGVTKPVLTPEQAAQAVHREEGRSAYVFGPERSGLETDDVALARAIVTVPINPEFGSLNLAQAVILLAYEWSKQADLAQPTVEDLLPPAPQEELEGMIAQLEAMLEPAGYFRPPARVVATRRTLRTMLTKPGWNHLEVRTMRGVLSALGKGPRRT